MPKKINDAQLRQFAEDFLKSFYEEAKSGVAPQDDQNASFMFYDRGSIRLTNDINDALTALTSRAASLLGSKNESERAVRDIAFKQAQDYAHGAEPLHVFIDRLVDQISEEADAAYEYLAPNQIIRFEENLKEIQIGKVRALYTSDYSSSYQSEYPKSKLQIISEPEAPSFRSLTKRSSSN